MNNASKKNLRLFFSYGHDKNQKIVKRMKSDIEARGHEVWIDTNKIKAKDNWREIITDGLKETDLVVAFLSKHSTESTSVCLDELKIAVGLGKIAILPVLLEPQENISIPSFITEIQWMDMIEWSEKGDFEGKEFQDWYQNKFKEFYECIESSNVEKINGEIKILKRKLRPYLYSTKGIPLLSKKYYERKWLEQMIQNWLSSSDCKPLILYGKPGSGKSAFAVNYTFDHPNVLGCFFCEWDHDYTKHPEQWIRTMAFKLASGLPDYREILLQQLQDIGESVENMGSTELFETLISYPLNLLINGERETKIIIVDGLDEAETENGNVLAEMFSKYVVEMPEWIRFIFTSRPERDVSDYFQTDKSVNIVEDAPKRNNDIKEFLQTTLKEELRQVPNKKELLERACELSDGTFLYAEFLVSDIKNGLIKLDHIEKLPQGLDGFYRVSLSRIFKNKADYESIRPFMEILCTANSIPEKILENICNYTKHNKYLNDVDRLGSFIVRYEENGISMLTFSHKSIRDWLIDEDKSGFYNIDQKSGALQLARYCKQQITEKDNKDISSRYNHKLIDYMITHVGEYFAISENYSELEEFLLSQKDTLTPYWYAWQRFPKDWDNTHLLKAFWQSKSKNDFIKRLQKEGNATLLKWIYDESVKTNGIASFERDDIKVYTDIIHISGDYPEAADIVSSYLKNYNKEQIKEDESLSMLSVREIHYLMFYTPVESVLKDAKTLFSYLDDRFPEVYGEILFLIGGNLGVLSGKWNLCKKWLSDSETFAKNHNLADFHTRNIRKIAECMCHKGEIEKAQLLLEGYIGEDLKINTRYDAYLIGALGNIYTCLNLNDDAIKCYRKLLQYVLNRGISSWKAHAYLGIANVNISSGCFEEAETYIGRARDIYSKISQEWGLIMSDALSVICKNQCIKNIERSAFSEVMSRAEKLGYGSCIEEIEAFVNGDTNCIRLYFL